MLIGDGNLALVYDDNYIGDNADIASSEGILISGERAVYTATYQITQEAEETGFVSNVVTVTANGPDDVGRPPTDEQGRLVPTERDESKADYIPGVETLGRDSLRVLRKAIYGVVATIGAHINDAPDQ